MMTSKKNLAWMQARTGTIEKAEVGSWSEVPEIAVAKEARPCWRSPLCLRVHRAIAVVMVEWWRRGCWSSVGMR